MTTHSEITMHENQVRKYIKAQDMTAEQLKAAQERAARAREGRRIAIEKRKKAEYQRAYREKVKARKENEKNKSDSIVEMVKAATGNPQKPDAPWMPPPPVAAPKPKVVPSTEALEAKIASLEHQAIQYRIVIDYLESKIANLQAILFAKASQ